MKQPEFISKGSLERMIQAAEAAWEQKNFQAALKTMESATRLAPANASLLLRLGQMQGLRHDYAAAERSFERVLKFAPRKMEMLAAIAEHCQSFRNPEIQRHYLQRAIAEPNPTPVAFLKLGELCERLRRLPEAAQHADRALKLNPAYPAALLLRARLERLAGRFEQAEIVLRSFITKPIPSLWVHAQAWYELGNILDRREQYDEAMKAILEAKALLQGEATRCFGKATISYEDLATMEAGISAEMLQRWFDIGPALQPERRVALLCGHPRSGTTLLEQVLDAHPEIVSAEETDSFRNEALPALRASATANSPVLNILEAATLPQLQQARSGYFSFMEEHLGSPIANRLLIDKNPILTVQIPAFLCIFPEARFLVALRDPRDVVLSRFMIPQPVFPLATPFFSLEGTTEAYAITMGIWRTVAPLMPAPYLEVRYEDMVEDLESVARRTLDFLGVSWDTRVLGFDDHARKKMVRSPTYADVTQPVYKRAMGRWRHYQKYLEPYLDKLEPFVKAFGYE